MPETTPLIKAALNLRVGAGFDVYEFVMLRASFIGITVYQKIENVPWRLSPIKHSLFYVFV